MHHCPSCSQSSKLTILEQTKREIKLFLVIFTQFNSISFKLGFVFPSEYHEWPATPISPFLRWGPHSCFHQGCGAGAQAIFDSCNRTPKLLDSGAGDWNLGYGSAALVCWASKFWNKTMILSLSPVDQIIPEPERKTFRCWSWKL